MNLFRPLPVMFIRAVALVSFLRWFKNTCIVYCLVASLVPRSLVMGVCYNIIFLIIKFSFWGVGGDKHIIVTKIFAVWCRKNRVKSGGLPWFLHLQRQDLNKTLVRTIFWYKHLWALFLRVSPLCAAGLYFNAEFIWVPQGLTASLVFFSLQIVWGLYQMFWILAQNLV